MCSNFDRPIHPSELLLFQSPINSIRIYDPRIFAGLMKLFTFSVSGKLKKSTRKKLLWQQVSVSISGNSLGEIVFLWIDKNVCPKVKGEKKEAEERRTTPKVKQAQKVLSKNKFEGVRKVGPWMTSGRKKRTRNGARNTSP